MNEWMNIFRTNVKAYVNILSYEFFQRPFEHQYSEMVGQTRMASILDATTIFKKCLAIIGNYGSCPSSPGNI